MAADGLRVLAFAERNLPQPDLSQEKVELDLTFTGLVGFQDPPRPVVRDAIASCQLAGVRVIMITGDHPLTAKAIGRQVGLDGDDSVVTGSELDQLSDDQLKVVVKRSSILRALRRNINCE